MINCIFLRQTGRNALRRNDKELDVSFKFLYFTASFQHEIFAAGRLQPTGCFRFATTLSFYWERMKNLEKCCASHRELRLWPFSFQITFGRNAKVLSPIRGLRMTGIFQISFHVNDKLKWGSIAIYSVSWRSKAQTREHSICCKADKRKTASSQSWQCTAQKNLWSEKFFLPFFDSILVRYWICIFHAFFIRYSWSVAVIVRFQCHCDKNFIFKTICMPKTDDYASGFNV